MRTPEARPERTPPARSHRKPHIVPASSVVSPPEPVCNSGSRPGLAVPAPSRGGEGGACLSALEARVSSSSWERVSGALPPETAHRACFQRSIVP